MPENDERPSLLERLERQRLELLRQIELNPLPEIDQMTYGSQAEAASDVFEQERALTFRRHLEAQLRDVDDAIERVRGGNQGLCISCGEPIPAERLAILPEAKLCIGCQRRSERRR
jgi:DnaK suppressor protein